MLTMHSLSTLLCLSGSAFIAASTLPAALEPRVCSRLILPTNFYGISSTALDTTFDYGPFKPPTDPFFDFFTSELRDRLVALG